MSFTDSALLAAWVAIALLGFALAGVVRQVRVLSSSGPTPLPSSGSPNIGKRLPGHLLATHAKRHVFLFVKPHCDVCEQRLEEFDALAGDYAPGLACAAVFSHARNGFEASHVNVFPSQAHLLQDFDIPVTPYGIIASGDGTIVGSRAVGSEGELRSLMDQAAEGANV
jgi:hypothetical protein